jgi:hypothetical protein
VEGDTGALLAEFVDCFSDASNAGQPARFSVNYCLDCTEASTFVSTPAAAVFHVFRLIDPYGTLTEGGELLPPRRESRVESCRSIDILEGAGGPRVRCVEPVVLFECTGEISDLDSSM